MNKRSKRLNLIICGIAFVIMIVFLFFVDDPKEIWKAVISAKPQFMLLTIGCMVLYWLLESVNLHLVAKEVHPEQKFKNSLSVSMIGQYFNCITPFSSGGQPIQAYYLMKFGVPLGSALTALLSKFIVYQAMLTVYSACILIFRLNYITETEPIMLPLVIIGFIVNTAVIAGLLMLAFFRKPTVKIAHFTVRLLGKLRIVKDVDARLNFIDNEMEMYYKNFQFIKKRPVLILKMCFFTVIQLTVYFGISYVIYLAFGLSGSDFLTIISCQAFVLMISAFVPLPGALGAAEGSYVLFFKGIFGGYVHLSTVIWRFLTFYLAIIAGMAVSLAVNRKNNFSDEEAVK
ncbi:MAG: flippase-like domain-containing protein [Firmicutes bacterium]|nr:flippase-like domain-containing protein [[Eubacterium] siraeum]MCM1488038.1 flippase-like domain-containing protein [Bacillota bacterium]